MREVREAVRTLREQREIEDVAAALGGPPESPDLFGSSIALRIGGHVEIFRLGTPCWARLLEMARRVGPALPAAPAPGLHRARTCVYWTGARWASGEDPAPRPNTPRAVLVADLPPPLAHEVLASAEPTKRELD